MQNSKKEFLVKKGKEFSKKLIANATKWELEFKRKLEKLKISFIFQYPVIYKNEKLYIIDFYIPVINLGIELDGSFHYTKENIKKDKLRTKHLAKEGIIIIRIQNSLVSQITPENLKTLFKNYY